MAFCLFKMAWKGMLMGVPYQNKCPNGHPWPDSRRVAGKLKKSYCAPCKNNRWNSARIPEQDRKRVRKNWLKRAYNLTVEQYEEMLNGQDRRCAICQTKDFGKRPPMIDHNHKTNQVRGILCHYCNTGIGLFRDNFVSLLNASKYLEKYEI